MYRNIKSVEYSNALQADIYLLQQWCTENYMELNIQINRIITYTRKTNNVNFNYYVSNVTILRSYCIKDIGVMLGSKLYFHFHVDIV
jgi:hypothetical protein